MHYKTQELLGTGGFAKGIPSPLLFSGVFSGSDTFFGRDTQRCGTVDPIFKMIIVCIFRSVVIRILGYFQLEIVRIRWFCYHCFCCLIRTLFVDVLQVVNC